MFKDKVQEKNPSLRVPELSFFCLLKQFAKLARFLVQFNNSLKTPNGEL